MALFDWLPEPKWLSWTILVAACFILAALFVFFPCQTTIFAGMAGNSC